MKHLITFNESFEKNPDEDRELVLDIFQDIIDEYELQELDDTLGWSDMVDSIFNCSFISVPPIIAAYFHIQANLLKHCKTMLFELVKVD